MVGNCKRELLEYCFKLRSLYLNSCQFSERHWEKKMDLKGFDKKPRKHLSKEES